MYADVMYRKQRICFHNTPNTTTYKFRSPGGGGRDDADLLGRAAHAEELVQLLDVLLIVEAHAQGLEEESVV